MLSLALVDLGVLNQALSHYDNDVYSRLDLVLNQVGSRSQALASNLKDCFNQIRLTDRYLRAYQGQFYGLSERDFTEEEFMIFRKYVRLLRSCTILCGHQVSKEIKELFLDFFSGRRIQLARDLGNNANNSN